MLSALRRRTPVMREARELAWACRSGEVLPLRWVLEPRARRLRLIVQEGGIRLTVPPGVAESTARRFVEAHEPWLLRHWQQRPAPASAVPWAFGSHDALPLAGDALSVQWREARWCRLERDGGALRFDAPPTASAASLQRAVREFYLAEARTAVGRWLPAYLATLPRAPSAIRLRPMRSLWGSLSPQGAVSLDLALVLGPSRPFEYVLVHELCHLLQRNHGPRFWAEVAARCPDWPDQRDWLRSREGLALKAQWATSFRSSR
jgi:predicted metal-dependent hydrolase